MHCVETKQLASEYEAAKAQLEDNDTYTQVCMYMCYSVVHYTVYI